MTGLLLIALVAGLVLVAVPLYLWRRPKPTRAEVTDAGGDAALADAGSLVDAAATALATALDGGTVSTNEISLDKVKVVKCQRPGPGRTSPDQCDRQVFFEDALVKAVLENVSCAPKTPKGGTVSFALKVDHKKRSVHLWAGRSGTIRSKRAAPVIECVTRAMPTPDWDTLPHQYTVYTIQLVATYPASEKAERETTR